MVEATITIKLLTPTLVGGADPFEDCVFSEKALKGLLRYWWRAFLSEPNWNNRQLLENESKIFGGQNSKSKFSIIVLDDKLKIDKVQNLSNIDKSGFKYLIFPLALSKDKPKRTYYLEPDQKINFKLICKDSNILNSILTTLWFFENFGGIGARSRRGFGSFKVIDIKINGSDNHNFPEFLYKKEKDNFNFNELKNFLSSNFSKFINKNRKNYNNLPNFTSYSKNYTKILIILKSNNFFNSYLDALDFIGDKLMEFRLTYFNRNLVNKKVFDLFKNEAKALHEFAKENKTDKINELETETLSKTAFGLPIKYNFRDTDVKVLAKGTEHERRGSPLFIKIGEYKNKYFIILTFMWSKFLSDNEKLLLQSMKKTYKKIEKDNKEHYVEINEIINKQILKLPGTNAIEKFLDNLREEKIEIFTLN